MTQFAYALIFYSRKFEFFFHDRSKSAGRIRDLRRFWSIEPIKVRSTQTLTSEVRYQPSGANCESAESDYSDLSKKLKFPDIIHTMENLMKISKILASVFAGIALIAGVSSCNIYNNLVELDEQVSAQWAQVENQYQRRYDLIPNLVSTVKGAASHETELYTQVAEARAKAGGVIKVDSNILEDEEKFAEFQKVQDSLGGVLQRLLSVTENYPELKTNQNFLALQDELEGTENRISTERKRYNDLAQKYNASIRKWPGVVIAGKMNFKAKPYFTAATQAATAPAVQF